MRKNRNNLIGLVIAIVTIIASILWVMGRTDQAQAPIDSTSQTLAVTNQVPPAPQPTPQFDTSQYSTDNPLSPWVIVNKHRPLPDGYTPNDLVTPAVALAQTIGSDEMKLRAEAAKALEALFASAAEEQHQLLVVSAYRSQQYQSVVYNGFVNQMGREEADRSSARPGHSEHQTGWAVDVGNAGRTCEIEECFGDTPEGIWVKNNAVNFGFIVRYEPGNESQTGYIYEPWHLRYVGKELAKELVTTGKTLEQYFNLPPPTDYLE